MTNNYEPFGLRVFVQRKSDPLSNFGKDIYVGLIVKVPTRQSINHSVIINSFSNNYQPMNEINYNELFSETGALRIGTKINFKYNPEIVDNVSDDIYNVPIDLIRSCSYE